MSDIDEFYIELTSWYRTQAYKHSSNPDPSDPDYTPHPDTIIESETNHDDTES